MNDLERFPFTGPAPRWKATLTYKYIEDGGSIPRGWAISHRDFRLCTKVAYPIPLHLLVRWSRDLLFWLMKVGYPGYRQRIEHRIFLIGVDEGVRQEMTTRVAFYARDEMQRIQQERDRRESRHP